MSHVKFQFNFSKKDKTKDETILLKSDWENPPDPTSSRRAATCRTKNGKDHVKVVLKGLCSHSQFDTEYVLHWMPMNLNPNMYPSYWWQGRSNSSIIYVGDRKWKLHDGTEHWKWMKADVPS